ncbi:MAG: flagellar basal body-associated protein FliL [Pseudomonadales bacterium]|nr:flagellar basal body-associated protein FliL [Pseudomonadales bacterium]
MAEASEPIGISRKIMWLVGILILLLLLATAANIYLMLQNRNADSELVAETDAEAEEEEEPEVAPIPIFVKLAPLTVNLLSDKYSQRLLYTSMSLKVDNEETQDIIMTHMPEVHSRLLLLLSAQKAEELVSADGKEELSKKILALFEQPLTRPQPPLAISAVLFNDFIVQ